MAWSKHGFRPIRASVIYMSFYKKGCHTCPLPLLWHEFDNCLTCNFLQWKASCCLHKYFLWRHHLPPDKSKNDQDSDSDIHIILTYNCWYHLLVFNIWASHEILITHATLELFSFTQPFTTNFVYPTIFSPVSPPVKKNDQSLSLQNFASIIHWCWENKVS